ncbi:MAG: xylose isomerase [Bacteroidetes bacterium RBG_13_42_15]|nr:MAG: xylose isomerase [Bacteroidetes bacterium RBG_13_42_15]
MSQTRRRFIKNSISASMGAAILADTDLFGIFSRNTGALKISLAEWSLHRALFANEISNLDFPKYARNEFGIDALEYVSSFFKGTGMDYLSELLKRTREHGVLNLLIMVDNEGNLGDLYEPARVQAIERHYRWIDAAKILGCHSVRVNARGEGTAEEVGKAAADGLASLAEYAEKQEISVIVENHGGYSSNARWLADVISRVNSKYCGTLPDFGNFCIKTEIIEGKAKCINEYDKYLGLKELMPYAKGVSAKSHDFDDQGNETSTDYIKMMQIIKNAGYTGYIGIEYEGNQLSEKDGIIATKRLLEKVYNELF